MSEWEANVLERIRGLRNEDAPLFLELLVRRLENVGGSIFVIADTFQAFGEIQIRREKELNDEIDRRHYLSDGNDLIFVAHNTNNGDYEIFHRPSPTGDSIKLDGLYADQIEALERGAEIAAKYNFKFVGLAPHPSGGAA